MSDAPTSFKTVAEQELADKLPKKHHQDEESEVRASGNPMNTSSFYVARINAYPSVSRGTAFSCETAAVGRVHSRASQRSIQWQ